MSNDLDQRLGNPEWADNWTVGAGPRMEFIDHLGRVWLCHEPVTREQAHGLALPDGASLAGIGEAVADVAYFSRSPGATADGPLDVMEVDGLRFAYVGTPMATDRAGGAMVLSVDKHHTMLYRARRTIEVLDFGDGTVATPAWGGRTPVGDADLPDGWVGRTVELTQDLVAVIPNPATVVMLDGFGFHGPLPIPQLEEIST